jgi:hypothetical protein
VKERLAPARATLANRRYIQKMDATPRVAYRGAMHVGERVVAASAALEAPEIGWFAARQPAVVRFLEDRLASAHGSDRAAFGAFAVALDAARAIHGMFERQHGVPPPRVTQSLLERAEEAVIGEARTRAVGIAARQPALAAWVADLLTEPPVPLAADELGTVGTALAAVVYALDQVTTGRPIPP